MLFMSVSWPNEYLLSVIFCCLVVGVKEKTHESLSLNPFLIGRIEVVNAASDHDRPPIKTCTRIPLQGPVW
jgi:hypothetical protein